MLGTEIKEESETNKLITVKCPSEISDELQKMANKYTNGNLSAWLRYAGLNCIPRKEDIAQLKKIKKK